MELGISLIQESLPWRAVPSFPLQRPLSQSESHAEVWGPLVHLIAWRGHLYQKPKTKSPKTGARTTATGLLAVRTGRTRDRNGGAHGGRAKVAPSQVPQAAQDSAVRSALLQLQVKLGTREAGLPQGLPCKGTEAGTTRPVSCGLRKERPQGLERPPVTSKK